MVKSSFSYLYHCTNEFYKDSSIKRLYFGEGVVSMITELKNAGRQHIYISQGCTCLRHVALLVGYGAVSAISVVKISIHSKANISET